MKFFICQMFFLRISSYICAVKKKNLVHIILAFLSTLLPTGTTWADGKSTAPHAVITVIWAYGDKVTDSTALGYKQNNLRFFCGNKENISSTKIDYLFMLEGHDADWIVPFAEGWFFYTDLPPGDYVFRAKCRLKGGKWGEEMKHHFVIACPWWRTWWALTLYILLSMGILIYIFYLVRERIRLHNRLKVEEETKYFREELVMQASRDLRSPISVIRSTIEKLGNSSDQRLSRTDVQHLRNSSQRLLQMTEDLINFTPSRRNESYSQPDDVLEMMDVPLNEIKVLLVESDEELADVIQRDLTRVMKVKRCGKAEEVMDMMHEYLPDAVVLDTSFEAIGAYDILKQIKRELEVIVVLISDFDSNSELLRAVRSEADDFIRKPFSSQFLTALLVKRFKIREKSEEREFILSSKPMPIIENHADKLFIERLDMTIQSNLSNPAFDVNSLAETLKISRSQLYNKVKSLKGYSPVDYLRRCRIEKAAMLINTTDDTILNIMYKVGMSDPTNFYRRFKEQYGVSPKEYRQSNPHSVK